MTFFALIRAVALAISAAIAFGLDTPDAYWMPPATLVAEQRLAGAIIGAIVAAVFLFTIDSKPALEFVIAAFLGVAIGVVFMFLTDRLQKRAATKAT